MTQPRNLLVVEDEANVRRALRRVLERLSHTVTVCTTVAEARATTATFDAGIFDIELPDGSGLDVAAELLSGGRVASAVFFSGTSDEAAKKRASELGRFVEKRGGAQELVAALLHELGERDDDVRLAACAEGEPQSTDGSSPPDTVKRRKS